MIKDTIRLNVVPLLSVNEVEFGTNREIVRKAFKGKYKETKKSLLAKNTMDFYGNYAIYYSENNQMEAVEVFGKTKVIIDGKQVFPGKIEDLMALFPNLKQTNDGFVDEENSVAITVDQDDGEAIGTVLFATKGYYS